MNSIKSSEIYDDYAIEKDFNYQEIVLDANPLANKYAENTNENELSSSCNSLKNNTEGGLHIMLPLDGTLHILEVSDGGLYSKVPSNKLRGNKRVTKEGYTNHEFNFKCSVSSCGKEFSSLIDFRRHKKTHSSSITHFCDICDKKFATGYGLKSHKRLHTGERPYTCPDSSCHKKFNTAGDLQKHIRTHTGEKPYHCKFCDRAFTTSNTRKIHMRIHTGEKPFECNYEGCNRKFAASTNYKNHMRIHTGEKPYKCTYKNCQRRFTEYSSLSKHCLTHSGDRKLYVCNICNKEYKQLSALNVHLNTAGHNEETNSSNNICLSEIEPIEKSQCSEIWNSLLEPQVSSDVPQLRTSNVPQLRTSNVPQLITSNVPQLSSDVPQPQLSSDVSQLSSNVPQLSSNDPKDNSNAEKPTLRIKSVKVGSDAYLVLGISSIDGLDNTNNINQEV